MNKYKAEIIVEERQKLNVFSSVLFMDEKGYLYFVQKKKNDVIISPGGSSIYGKMRAFSESEKRNLFRETMVGYFNKDGHCLYNISNKEIMYLYREILSDEVKNNISKFNAMIEGIQESGKIFFRELQLLHRENVGEHKKYFFAAKEYIFFSVIGGHLEGVLAEEGDLDTHPIEGRDFFCQDEDLSSSRVRIHVKELLESFRNRGDLAIKYGSGAHRVALRKLLEQSDYFKKEENKNLVFLLDYVK